MARNTTTHTIQVVRSPSTITEKRVSKSREYQACLVYTVTTKSVELALARKVKWEGELAQANQELTSWCSKLGMTVSEAEKVEREAASEWHAKWFDAASEVRAAMGRPYAPRSEVEPLADALLESRGLKNPYAVGGPHEITHLQSVVCNLSRALAGWAEPVIGDEHVVSWHLTVGNAQKALTSWKADWAEKLGHSLAIRTDIQVVSR